MIRLCVIVAAILALGLECGDNEIPRCEDYDECSGDMFCTRDGRCECPGVGTCLIDPAP